MVPIYISGVRVRNTFIDLGARVNLIPLNW